VEKVVYLDQKDWIRLSQMYYGKNKNSKLKEALDKVISASNRGVIFPVSVVHLIETIRRSNHPQVERLSKFIINISKGHTILPYSAIINKEIKEAFFKTVKYPYLDRGALKSIVIGKGVSKMLGVTPHIVSKDSLENRIPKELEQKLLKEIEKPEALLLGFTANYQDYPSERVNCEIVEELEQIRKEIRDRIPDKDLRSRYNIAKHITDSLLPELNRLAFIYGLQDKLLEGISSKEKCLKLMQDIPTSYCSFVLTDRRDRDHGRPISKTDLWDITALSIAIPYCDIVLADRMFGSIAKSGELDKLYKTDICCCVEELADKL